MQVTTLFIDLQKAIVISLIYLISKLRDVPPKLESKRLLKKKPDLLIA